MADSITDSLEQESVWENFSDVADRLDRQGFVARLGWTGLKLGARPLPEHIVEPGDWAHGWQYPHLPPLNTSPSAVSL